MQSAQLFGPARVFAVDRVDYRLALAAELGAEPVDLDQGDPAEQLSRLTGGRSPDVVLECVGHETPFTQAIQAVRAGGAVSSVGVYVENTMGFPAREAFFKDLSLKMGICNARNYIAPLLPLVRAGKLRPLAGSGEERIAALSDLPTFKELGHEVEFYLWAGLFAPARTPALVLEKLRDAVRLAVEDPDFMASMATMETPVAYLDAPDFQVFLDKHAARLHETVKQTVLAAASREGPRKSPQGVPRLMLRNEERR